MAIDLLITGDNMKESILAFNAFQIVILFVCLPFIISWLWTATFKGSFPLSVVAIITYIILFFYMIGNTYHNIMDCEK